MKEARNKAEESKQDARMQSMERMAPPVRVPPSASPFYSNAMSAMASAPRQMECMEMSMDRCESNEELEEM